MAGRKVTLALVNRQGDPLGLLPLPGETPAPWWQAVDEVVDLAREAHGLDVTILRLLTTTQPFPGGELTYVAEYNGPPLNLIPAPDATWTVPHPLRMPWANPGGPAATIEWATAVLAGQGRTVLGARQRRSWNLSSIWQLTTDTTPAWSKEVPPFFAHEGTVLRWLNRPNTPQVLATDGTRLLLEHIPGEDRHHATPAERAAMLRDLLDIQTEATATEPLKLGVPDLRAKEFQRQVERAAHQERHTLGKADQTILDDFVADLPARFQDLTACGIPETLVHGDFHPGNVRSDGTRGVILDWGDSIVAHPALDLVRMRDWHDPLPELTKLWCDHWRERVPGSEPERAVELIEPLAVIRGALVYGGFVTSIEPDEQPYHQDDVRASLRDTVAMLRTSPDA